MVRGRSGIRYTRFEEGQDPAWEGSWENFKFEKFKAKKSPAYSAYYDWKLDMKSDDFLKSLTDEEKEDYMNHVKELRRRRNARWSS